MEIELHCVLCGGMLAKGGDDMECLSCGAGYTDIVVSESIPFDESEPREVSVSMESFLAKRKPDVAMPLEMQPAIEESIAV